MATTYTKGTITFRRNDNGTLERVRPSNLKTVYVGVQKTSSGTKTYRLNKEQANQAQKANMAAKENFLQRQTQSISPTAFKNRSTVPVTNRRDQVIGYLDLQRKESVVFNKPQTQQQFLRIEQQRGNIKAEKAITLRRTLKTLNPPPAQGLKVSSPRLEKAIKKAELLRRKYSNRLASLKGLSDTPGGLDVTKARLKASSNLLAYAFAGEILKTLRGAQLLPETVALVLRDPSILKNLPSSLSKSGKNYINLWRTRPSEAIVVTGSNILILKGVSKVIGEFSSLSRNVLLRLSPKFKGVGRVGSILTLKISPNKIINLRVVGKLPKESLKKQVSRAGSKLDAVSSQQQALLKKLLSRKKTVRKPIPGESLFKGELKRLLAKFDKGSITKKEILKLDILIRKKGGKGLLERTFFADPTGKIRPSRLGLVTPESSKSVLDYLKRDITFKKPKPQILLFSDIRVAKWPKYLIKIKNKVSRNKKLTLAESNKLLQWQLSKPGKFKPLGFVSGESEIILPPGSILVRKKIVGYTLINRKKVPIILTEAQKPSGKLKGLLSKWEKGTITKKELSTLDKILKKQSGFNYGLSYSPKVNARYVSIKRLTSSGLVRSLPKSKAYSVKKSYGSSSKVSRSLPKKSVSTKSISVSKKPSPIGRRVSPISSKSRFKGGSSSRAYILASKYYGTRTANKLKSIAKVSRVRKKTKFSKQEVKYMLSKIFVKSKYRPDLAALIYGITGFKAPKKITGFEIRPILKR